MRPNQCKAQGGHKKVMMIHKKATNKQVMDAYGQSYKLMQEGKRFDDEQRKKDSLCKKHHIKFDYYNGKPVCPICKKW